MSEERRCLHQMVLQQTQELAADRARTTIKAATTAAEAGTTAGNGGGAVEAAAEELGKAIQVARKESAFVTDDEAAAVVPGDKVPASFVISPNQVRRTED